MTLNNNIAKIKDQLLSDIKTDFFITEYKKFSNNEKSNYFKNVVNAANYVFTYNEKYGTLNETTIKTGSLNFIEDYIVLNVRNKLSEFLNSWMTEECDLQFNKNMIYDFVKNDRSFFFTLLSQNHDKGLLDYTEFTNYLIDSNISQQISPIEFMQQFQLSEDNVLCYYHYLQTIEKYFSLNEIKDDEFYNLYCLSFKQKKGIYFLHEQANDALTAIIQEKFTKEKLNKKEFFQFLFDKNLKFSEKDKTLGMAVRTFIDEDIVNQFYKEIIEAIPDNFPAFKKDSTYGLFHALKNLKTTKTIESDPAIQILHMLKIGSAKQNFMEFFEQNGLKDTVKKMIIFKENYPNIYKSAFTNKNPIVVNPSDLKSISAFELVMIHMDLDKSLFKNNIKNRL